MAGEVIGAKIAAWIGVHQRKQEWDDDLETPFVPGSILTTSCPLPSLTSHNDTREFISYLNISFAVAWRSRDSTPNRHCSAPRAPNNSPATLHPSDPFNPTTKPINLTSPTRNPNASPGRPGKVGAGVEARSMSAAAGGQISAP
jgi:hypothetical protein